MTSETAPPPTGIKGKANAVATDLFMKAPPTVQNGLLNGIGKAQPVVNVLKPHAKKIGAGLLGLFLVRKLRGRKR